MIPVGQLDVDALDRTVWGEARGESFEGKIAVAHVILNRVAEGIAFRKRTGRKHYRGETVAEVCQKKWQFSCWNENDPNLPKLKVVDEQDKNFILCGAASRGALSGVYPDPTDGATHYHTTAIKAFWSAGKTPTTRIGHHVFYKGIL